MADSDSEASQPIRRQYQGSAVTRKLIGILCVFVTA